MPSTQCAFEVRYRNHLTGDIRRYRCVLTARVMGGALCEHPHRRTFGVRPMPDGWPHADEALREGWTLA